jgi:hypothetical protein
MPLTPEYLIPDAPQYSLETEHNYGLALAFYRFFRPDPGKGYRPRVAVAQSPKAKKSPAFPPGFSGIS